MFRKKGISSILVMALLCLSVTLTSSRLPAATHVLSSTAEQTVVGGSDCNDVFGGFALGMSVASLLGCAWCPAGAVGAKVLEMFVC